MKLDRSLYYLSLIFVFFSCSSKKSITKKNKVYKFEEILSFQKCSDPVNIDDKIDEKYPKINLNNLSYSTAYTSVYTNYRIKSDSLQKDSIRYIYAKKIKNLVQLAFPNIELTNASELLKKSYPFIAKNHSNIVHNDENSKESINKLIVNTKNYGKQLFINIYSHISKDKLKVSVSLFVFEELQLKLLYKDHLSYQCDIRDYESLEKVISFALLKLKRNFE